jgi:peptidoglycan/LPS O-acetylase OafA/YrhL
MTRHEEHLGTYQIMDAARMVAALTVAFSHIRDLLLVDFSSIAAPNVFLYMVYAFSGLGHAGVVVFFVLSGFWITQSVVRRAGVKTFWPAYLIDRMSRLWIVLLPALALGGLLDVFGAYCLASPVYRGLTGAHSISPDSWAAITSATLIGNVAFLTRILVPPFGSNGPLWSLAFEFWYYLWFPALWLALRHRRYSFGLLAFAIAFANWQVAIGFVSWLMGSVLYALITLTPWRKLPRGWRTVILLSGLSAFACALAFARTGPSQLFDPVLAATFAWVLAGIFFAQPRSSRLLQPIAHYGARSSFSLYATHFPVAALAAAVIAGPVRMQPSLASIGTVVALLALAAVIGKIFSSLTEAQTDWLRTRARALIIRNREARQA